MINKTRQDLIIVPCDFTEEAANALAHASAIAKAGNDEVRLIHVINRETRSKLKKEKLGEEAVDIQLREWALKNEFETGVKTSYYSEEGSIFNTIGEYIHDSNAELAVMGTHGVHGVQHLVGAFAIKVVTSSPVPVVIVQQKGLQSGGYKKIVIPIDSQKYGKNKLIHAISMSKYFDGEIHLFAEHASDEFVQRQITLNLGNAENLMRNNGVTYHVEHQNPKEGGAFAKQLLRYAAQKDVDLIVISTQQDTSALENLFLGNNEEAIINNDAQIAVMCVNPVQDTSFMGNVMFN